MTSALALLLLLGAGAPVRAEEVLPREIFRQVAGSTVRIRADDCPSSGGAGSSSRQFQGFFEGPAGEIVTVRHGVAGCGSVTVTVFGGDDLDQVTATLRAEVVKTDRRSDLALLRVRGPAPARPVLRAGAADPAHAIFAVARWLGASGPRDKLMRVANGAKHLRGILNGGALAQIAQSGSPDLDLEVINLDVGIIVQGTSGSPIVDTGGTVVGVADGGLENGVSGVTWAVRAVEIAKLRDSREPLPTRSEGALAAVQFATEPGADVHAPAVRCNGFELRRLRSARYGDIQRTADDPAGLTYLTQFATQLGFDGASDRFDVWQDLESGAALALPAGTALRNGDGPDGDCTAEVASGVALRVHLEETDGTPGDVQRVSVAFEAALAQGGYWQVDPSVTYLAPLNRPDGLVVTRKTAKEVTPPNDMLFETLAHRGTTFVGYAAFLRGEPLLGNKLALCVRGGAAYAGLSPGDCRALMQKSVAWARSFVAVQLTTFTRSR